MAVLAPSEYNASYFDGRLQAMKHNAGYDYYARWPRVSGDLVAVENSTGEMWKDYAARIHEGRGLSGKKCLEIGCAKGFVVEDLRNLGVDCWGIDVSSYAINGPWSVRHADRPTAPPAAVAPFLSAGDALTELASYKNDEWDLVFSLRFMECISDADLPGLITEMNRISRGQFHVIDEFDRFQVQDPPKAGAGAFYNAKTLEDWLAFGWRNGTFLISQENSNRVLEK